MDGQPVSFHYVATVRHGRSKMSNRSLNQYRIPSHTAAMRAKAPVFNTERGKHEKSVGGHSKQPPCYLHPTILEVRVPALNRPSYPIESTAPYESITTSSTID